jgi:hypothetical protein
MHIIDRKIARKRMTVLCHRSCRQAAFGQSHHSAEPVAVPLADVRIDEMINIVQAQRRRRQDFLHEPEQIQIVDWHHLVFHARRIHFDFEVSVRFD